MYGFTAFVAYILLVLIIGALLAVPLHALLQPMVEVRLDRLVTRAPLLIALFTLYPLLKFLGVANRQALGYAIPSYRFRRDLGWGILAGIGMLAPLLAMLLVLNLRVFKPDLGGDELELTLALVQGLLSGLIIGVTEETFFRGAIYSTTARTAPVGQAIILSSLLYAALHFVRIRYPVADPEWFSGLLVLGQALAQGLTPALIMDSFFALFAAGVLLAMIRAHRGNIALCIGIHAGWVLSIALIKHTTVVNRNAEHAFLVGHYDGVIGYLSLVWLSLMIGLVSMRLRRAHS